MYQDTILAIIAAVLLVIGVALSIFLICSRKRNQTYKRLLKEQTERVDIMTTVLEKTAQTGGVYISEHYPLNPGDYLPPTISEIAPTEPIHGQERKISETGNTLPLWDLKGKISEISNTTPLPGLNSDSVYNSTIEPQNVNDLHNEIHVDYEDVVAGTNDAEVGKGLDLSPLYGKYELLKEISGGGMSRVFLARNLRVGNLWIVKFIDERYADLANEAEFLKRLNHTSLPKIIDIFNNNEGTFLVESYIEGCTLDQVIKLGEKINESQICEWGEQLAQTLNYLHTLPTPIIHCDLKPSNIMVTHDNRLVLIDFGISKHPGTSTNRAEVTIKYAAPEQFVGSSRFHPAFEERFGKLPLKSLSWKIDERTDLYSMGVILHVLAARNIPYAGRDMLSGRVSQALENVIRKCVEIDPEKRYQSARELMDEFNRLNNRKAFIARSVMLRRIASVAMAAAFMGCIATSASAAVIYQTENASIVSMQPNRTIVTEQSSVELVVQKTKPNGNVEDIDSDKIEWTYSENNIARVDNNRLVGLNTGDVTLRGHYRNKTVTLDVTVVEPVEHLVETSLVYPNDIDVSVYAGNGERDFVDGTLKDSSFVSPENISADGKTVVVSDSGVIRVIESGNVTTTNLEPAYITADKVCSHNGDLYILTGVWQNTDDEYYYGFMRVTDGAAEFIYYTEAAWSDIRDFGFSSDGTLYYIQQNLGSGETTLNSLDVDSLEVNYVATLPDSASSMAFADDGSLYIAVEDDGVIIKLDVSTGEWIFFAGVKGELNFIDGKTANFYRPISLAADEDYLYVLDFDTVRRITIEDGTASDTVTLAGEPVADTEAKVVLGDGSECVFPSSELASIAVSRGKVLVTDPKNSVIYEITVDE